MKWTYKECDVTITAVWSVPSRNLTPIEEITCKGTEGQQIVPTTSNSFSPVPQWLSTAARIWLASGLMNTSGDERVATAAPSVAFNDGWA